VIPEIAELIETLSSREDWRRISHGNDLAWESSGVVVSLGLDEDETDVVIWTVEIEPDSD
jgi:hypothetical protein